MYSNSRRWWNWAGILSGPSLGSTEEKSIYTTGREFHHECVSWCPIARTLLFEILCYADKSPRGSNHLSVSHERDAHIPPLIAEFIVFIANPKMGSSCNTRHLITLSTPKGLVRPDPADCNCLVDWSRREAEIDFRGQETHRRYSERKKQRNKYIHIGVLILNMSNPPPQL